MSPALIDSILKWLSILNKSKVIKNHYFFLLSLTVPNCITLWLTHVKCFVTQIVIEQIFNHWIHPASKRLKLVTFTTISVNVGYICLLSHCHTDINLTLILILNAPAAVLLLWHQFLWHWILHLHVILWGPFFFPVAQLTFCLPFGISTTGAAFYFPLDFLTFKGEGWFFFATGCLALVDFLRGCAFSEACDSSPSSPWKWIDHDWMSSPQYQWNSPQLQVVWCETHLLGCLKTETMQGWLLPPPHLQFKALLVSCEWQSSTLSPHSKISQVFLRSCDERTYFNQFCELETDTICNQQFQVKIGFGEQKSLNLVKNHLQLVVGLGFPLRVNLLLDKFCDIELLLTSCQGHLLQFEAVCNLYLVTFQLSISSDVPATIFAWVLA